ncbi:MAG: C45 family autoproteolytic acyltransferase/hydrolase [Dongiaceae bacterium]
MMSSPIALLEIGGTPRQRGRAHGEGLRPLVTERDRAWRREIETRTRISADDFIEDFLQRTNFIPAIERWTPDLHEEVKGIAEGSGLGYRSILAAQFMDEEWWFQRQYRNHCSSFGAAARDGHPTLVGQTMDLPNWMDGFQTLLLIRGAQPGLDAYVVTAAGMIALTGVNSRGLGVSVNTLMQLNSSADGLPVAFVTRRLIETPALGDAVSFLGEARHASGQNYILGDATGVRDFECSAGRIAEHRGAAEGRIWHTNHPLANRDLRTDLTESWWERQARDSSCRLETLARRLEGGSTFTADKAAAMLSSRDHPEFPVSQEITDADDGFTFAAMIAELGPQPALRVAPGAPSRHPFAAFDFAAGLQGIPQAAE